MIRQTHNALDRTAGWPNQRLPHIVAGGMLGVLIALNYAPRACQRRGAFLFCSHDGIAGSLIVAPALIWRDDLEVFPGETGFRLRVLDFFSFAVLIAVDCAGIPL